MSGYHANPAGAAFRSPHHSPTSSASHRSPIHAHAQHPSPHLSIHAENPPSPVTDKVIAPPVRQYFDPTAEGRERKPQKSVQPELNGSTYSPPSPKSRVSHPEYQSPVQSIRPTYHSPVTAKTSYARPTSTIDTRQPTSPRSYRAYSGTSMAPPSATSATKEPSPVPSPKRNIMSFSNILSSDTKPPPSASPPTPRKPIPQSPTHQRSGSDHSSTHHPPSHSPRNSHHKPLYPVDAPKSNGVKPRSEQDANHKSDNHSAAMRHSADTVRSASSRSVEKIKPAPKPKALIHIPEKAYLVELTKLNEMEARRKLGEPDDEGYEEQREVYRKAQLKRAREMEVLEARKCKRRRMASTQKYAMNFSQRASIAKDNFFQTQEKAVADEIAKRSQEEEKEKKKVQQRNRRRELARQRHEKEAADLQQLAQNTEDQEQREHFLKQASKAEKKVNDTTRLLNGEIPNRDLREATPLAPNLDGGIMGSFPTGDDGVVEPPKKKTRTGTRPKKSKEQKRAEIDSAAAAHAAMERGDELVTIAPKGETTRSSARQEPSFALESSPMERSVTHITTKAYDLIYAEIWKDISRKMGRVHGIKDKSTATKVSNLRKTAQLASKEARRWQQKTNKSQKDTQARAKRSMREMLTFWKRNEREERDQRKVAEKQELESAKKAEADREANRQKRKLNFLISQTELYSHFIGKKVKTDEVERSTDDVTTATGETVKPGAATAHTVDLPDSVVKPGTKVTNFEDLDFDAEDETTLRQAAMANAQNAVQEAQDRARAFNTEGQLQSEFDDGEMNFQNPTSLPNGLDIPQPAMLACQLKEYQLKGLNWLVNLYEQGINGILADEMGLGKTVQSISVMAYLAEQHNIWGPFLVIAPSSTLHNWQQEITRFVPKLKCLPYWGTAKQRKTLRKFWDRKHITYTADSPFHVLITSYQLVVQDSQYFQKIRWQYMILDEAQAIKSSQSSRWKSLLGFHCRNRLLLTGTPIQNNMQELWALLHFIMPSLFDSHDEFSDWFSKDIESHAQSNTKLNEDQLKRLHMILKPFMLRRIKKNVQKELGDKIEEDVYCDLTYRQRAYYGNLRNKISIMDLIEKAALGDDQDSHTLMNLVMQFRKVCNHPDLFERAEVFSPVSFSYFAETASFLREGHNVEVAYSVRNPIEFRVPRLVARNSGRLDIAGPDNERAGWENRFLHHVASVWDVENMHNSAQQDGAFSWLPFVDQSAGETSAIAHRNLFERALDVASKPSVSAARGFFDDDKENMAPTKSMLNIVQNNRSASLSSIFEDGPMHDLLHVSTTVPEETMLNAIEPSAKPAVTAPPVELYASSQGVLKERARTFFNVPMRRALFTPSEKTEALLLSSPQTPHPISSLLPAPISSKARYTHIQVPSMRRFVTDSGKLARLDQLLHTLKEGGHRVLLYFQMTRMIDLMEEYLTYRNYRYCRLDGSTKLEDRRDTVADFQSPDSDIFVFLLSTRAGGLGINLTAADTVIFYDSDWNPTIDSQAMDRAHRLGQTRQVTVYRMITRSTIEERIRRRALQKEEVQRVVISGGAAGGAAGVDFNARSRENRTKDIAMWLADDDQAALIERKEAELLEKEEKREGEGKAKKLTKKQIAAAAARGRKEVSLDDMYHEGEGNFDDASKGTATGAATPLEDSTTGAPTGGGKKKGMSKKAKSKRERLAIVDGMA